MTKQNWIIGIGITVGALAGFLYWNYVGCNTGTCAIGSNPFISVSYGALLFGLTASEISKVKNKKTNE